MTLPRNKNTRLALLLGALFFWGLSWSQADIAFNSYSILNGLSQSSVTTIVEDNQHSIWFGTQEGLNKFDGSDFQTFQKDNTPGIENSFIYDACKDADGNLWFGSKNGLVYYNALNEKFQTFFPDKNKSWSFTQIAMLSKNKMLLLTAEAKAYVFDIKSKRFSYSNLSKIEPIQIAETQNHGLLVLGSGNQIVQLNENMSSSFLIKSSSNSIYGIFPIGETLFYFSANGNYKLNLDSKKQTSAFAKLFKEYQGPIKGLSYANRKWIIATDQRGLFIQDADGILRNYTADIYQNQSLPSNLINVLFKDDGGVFWLGTDRGTSSFTENYSILKKIEPSGNASKGLPCENVWSFQESKNKKEIIIGTDLGISIYDLHSGNFKHYFRDGAVSHSLGGYGSVMDIELLPNGDCILACYDGIFMFSRFKMPAFTPLKIKDPKLIHKHTKFYKIIPFHNNFLISTNHGLLFLDHRKKVFSEVNLGRYGKGVVGTSRDIFTDNKGTVWAITENIGLYKVGFKEGQAFLSSTPISFKKYTTDHLTCIEQANENTLILGTYGSGILKLNLKTHQVELINKKKGLPNNVINGIVNDEKGLIWISTNRGIASYAKDGNIESYNEKNGWETNEYNTNAYYKSSSGFIYFGGIFGFHYFNPEDVTSFAQDNYPIITKVVFDKPKYKDSRKFMNINDLQNSSNKIELDYSNRNFEVYFQPNALYAPQNINYKYIIVGEETDTVVLGKTNHISFLSLASGTYYIRLYSRIGNGKWTETPAILTVLINPPFWATIKFWMLSFIILCVAIYFYVRRRVDNARREKIKLEVKIVQRTKEIREQKQRIEEQNELINEEKNKVIEQQKMLFKEKESAEKWLKNALPSQVVKELKVRGKVQAKAYEMATILFTDVVGFTKIAESISPSRLVTKLDVLFRKFDQIILANNLEKIKTIGDAYMAVGGVPEKNSTHAIDSCLAAIQIQHYMEALKFDAIANHKDYWEIRIGINTGAVTAGIIGKLKIAYDVWGSSVNIAQRMEMLSSPGKITISQNTFNIIEPYFEYEYKEKAQMKSKAIIDMYEIQRIKPELSVDGEGLIPNDRFYQIVSLHYFSSIKYYKAENEMIKLLRKSLPDGLFYHSLDHTKDVVKSVERIALLEEVTDEGLFLLKTAALFHDAGFLEMYDNNEHIGARLAQEMLPKHGYTEQHIKTISDLIFVTQIPHKPVNKLQEIMCDADLDYLGRSDFWEISDRLKKELVLKKKIQSDKEWDEIQIKFLEQHKYFTATAVHSREERKQQNLEKVRLRLSETE